MYVCTCAHSHIKKQNKNVTFFNGGAMRAIQEKKRKIRTYVDAFLIYLQNKIKFILYNLLSI